MGNISKMSGIVCKISKTSKVRRKNDVLSVPIFILSLSRFVQM